MSKIDRATLIDIAVDMIVGSMMYYGTPEEEIRQAFESWSDEELVAFITE